MKMAFRQIKFRVRNRKTNEWIHPPHEIASLDGVNLLGETILFGGFMDGVSIEDLNEIDTLQFTGLKDKNGKEIFEGDIIKERHFDGWFDKIGEDYLGVVKYKTYSDNGMGHQFAGFVYYPDPDYTDFHGNVLSANCEVIGNIYDNPEILESFYIGKLR